MLWYEVVSVFIYFLLSQQTHWFGRTFRLRIQMKMLSHNLSGQMRGELIPVWIYPAWQASSIWWFWPRLLVWMPVFLISISTISVSTADTFWIIERNRALCRQTHQHCTRHWSQSCGACWRLEQLNLLMGLCRIVFPSDLIQSLAGCGEYWPMVTPQIYFCAWWGISVLSSAW